MMGTFANIHEYTIEQLEAWNRQIVNEIKKRHRRASEDALENFGVGDRVQWRKRGKGEWMYGTVTKINRTTLNINEDSGLRYKVPGGMLSREE